MDYAGDRSIALWLPITFRLIDEIVFLIGQNCSPRSMNRLLSNSNDPLWLADLPHLHRSWLPAVYGVRGVSRECRKHLLSIVTLTTLFLRNNTLYIISRQRWWWWYPFIFTVSVLSNRGSFALSHCIPLLLNVKIFLFFVQISLLKLTF